MGIYQGNINLESFPIMAINIGEKIENRPSLEYEIQPEVFKHLNDGGLLLLIDASGKKVLITNTQDSERGGIYINHNGTLYSVLVTLDGTLLGEVEFYFVSSFRNTTIPRNKAARNRLSCMAGTNLLNNGDSQYYLKYITGPILNTSAKVLQDIKANDSFFISFTFEVALGNNDILKKTTLVKTIGEINLGTETSIGQVDGITIYAYKTQPDVNTYDIFLRAGDSLNSSLFIEFGEGRVSLDG